jgi:hypothetical protein
MPTLFAVFACSRVIIDRSGAASVIDIMERIYVPTGKGPPREDHATPLRWSIFAAWHNNPDEQALSYSPRVEVTGPFASEFPVAQYNIPSRDNRTTKVYWDLMNLHIGRQGPVKIRVYLNRHPDSAGEYEFSIEHVQPPVMN